MTDLDPDRIPKLEKMARDANAAAIEQWNRADAAEAALAEAQEREQRVRVLAARWKSIKGMSEIGRGIDAALDGPQDGAT